MTDIIIILARCDVLVTYIQAAFRDLYYVLNVGMLCCE